MDEMLQSLIWKRDKGICQRCRAKLTEIQYTVNPKEYAAKELSALTEIPILKWVWKCWNCGKDTPVVTYDFVVETNRSIGEIKKLDKILMEKYPFVQTIHYKVAGDVIANTCVHCNKPQGNSYVLEQLIEFSVEGKDRKKLVDMVLPNQLVIEDFDILDVEPEPFEVRSKAGEIHHTDFNWENNNPSNLVLLCKDCHSKLGKKTTASRSRKAAKEEARKRKEKKQADKWRENYYSKKNAATTNVVR